MADVAIVIDRSLVDEDKFEILKNFAATLVNLFDVESGNIRIAVVVFGERADILVYLGR